MYGALKTEVISSSEMGRSFPLSSSHIENHYRLFHLSPELTDYTELIDRQYSPQCFLITGLNCTKEKFQAK